MAQVRPRARIIWAADRSVAETRRAVARRRCGEVTRGSRRQTATGPRQPAVQKAGCFLTHREQMTSGNEAVILCATAVAVPMVRTEFSGPVVIALGAAGLGAAGCRTERSGNACRMGRPTVLPGGGASSSSGLGLRPLDPR